MSSKSKTVVVRDRQGVLYAIPAETLKGYQIDESDFDSAAKFYMAGDDDVTGQRMMMDDGPWEDCVYDPQRSGGIPILKF